MVDWDDETNVGREEPLEPRGSTERNRAYLIVLAGSNVGEMYKLADDEVAIGRGQQADIQILDDGISRRHALFRLVGGDVIVEDLGSRNGTFVNGVKIARRQLRDGDKIQVGSTTILKFTYHDDLDETFQRQMYESALRDGLTRAYNKRYFLDRIDSELRFARRHKVPLSLLMMDIDHFKKINDGHGHLAGDHVLSTLAQLVHRSIRNEDVFARYGGEEFAVISRAIDPGGALTFAERLRAGVAAEPFKFGQQVIAVTVSIGVATVPTVDVAEPSALIAAADAALYDAKRGGRNRVCVAR